MPTQERLKELLEYDPETGIFIWSKNASSNVSGKQAGGRHSEKEAYVRIKVDGHHYLAHRLAWVWMTGNDPGGLSIDHKDGDPSNNSFENLRLADEYQQGANKQRRDVRYFPRINKWVARLQHQGTRHYLGVHLTKEDALRVIEEKRRELLKEFA